MPTYTESSKKNKIHIYSIVGSHRMTTSFKTLTKGTLVVCTLVWTPLMEPCCQEQQQLLFFFKAPSPLLTFGQERRDSLLTIQQEQHSSHLCVRVYVGSLSLSPSLSHTFTACSSLLVLNSGWHPSSVNSGPITLSPQWHPNGGFTFRLRRPLAWGHVGPKGQYLYSLTLEDVVQTS